jgi:tetratricopeptide (TPR) repeat protein
MSLTLLVWFIIAFSIAISALLTTPLRLGAARPALLSRLSVAASLMLVSAAALADDKSDCLDSSDHDQRIKGCSAIIERNPKDVVPYHNRGDAYGLKGDVDRAISDYTKAIVLNPNYAPAYNSRGRAYASKGDYIRAVDDVTKAGELTAKTWSSPAVVKAVPTKPKEVAKPALPVAGEAAVVEKTKAGELTAKTLPSSAVVKGVPAKPKEVAKPALPVAGKAAVVEKSSVPQKATVVEKTSKSPTAEKSTEDSWPAWAQSGLN